MPATAAPQYPVHDEDAAAAVAWLIDHATDSASTPLKVAVLGHSAGGGIIAAITTDERYLGAHGVALDVDQLRRIDGRRGLRRDRGRDHLARRLATDVPRRLRHRSRRLERGLTHPQSPPTRESRTTSSPPEASTGESNSTSSSSMR